MKLHYLLPTTLLVLALAPPAFSQAGDASYGREMLDSRNCSSCHKVDGEGGRFRARPG